MSLQEQIEILSIPYHTPCTPINLFSAPYTPRTAALHINLSLYCIDTVRHIALNRNNMAFFVKRMRSTYQKNDILQNFCPINSLF